MELKVIDIIKVNTNDEWNELIRTNIFLLVEIYSSEYGPCNAIQSSLQDFKMSIDNELFVLAQALSDDISCLDRFRNTSEPVWALIGHGKLIAYYFGCSPPPLFKLTKEEFDRELLVEANLFTRPKGKDFDELTDYEINRKLNDDRIKLQKETDKEIAMNYRMDKYRMSSLMRLIPQLTIVLYFENGKTPSGDYPVMQQMKMAFEELNMTIRLTEDILLTQEKIKRIFAFSGFDIPNQLEPHMTKCVASIIQYGTDPPPPDQVLLKVGEIERMLASAVYGVTEEGVIDPNHPLPDSIVGMNLTASEFGSAGHSGRAEKKSGAISTAKLAKVDIPILWTPINELSKSAAMSTIFPDKLENELSFILGDEPPPPMTLVAFEAYRSGGIELMLIRHRDLVYKYAYFTSHKPENKPELVTKTWRVMRMFDKHKIMQTKLIVGFRFDDDDKLVDFLLTTPLYVSDDMVTGSQMATVFFTPDFDRLEGEQPPEFPPTPLSSMVFGENEGDIVSRLDFDEFE